MQGADTKTKGRAMMLLGCIFFFMNNHMISIALPLLINDLGLGLEAIGYCTAGMGAMTIIAKLFTPYLVKSLRTRSVLVANYAILCAISLGICVAKSTVSLAALRTVYGAPFSIFPIVNLLVISRTTNDSDELTRTTSMIGMAMPISMTLSPLVVEGISSRASYQAVFAIALTGALLSALFYLCGTKDLDGKETAKQKDVQKPKAKTLDGTTAAFFFLGVIDILTLTYFPLIATFQRRSYSSFFALFAASMVLLQSLFPRIKASNGKKLTVGYILLSISSIAIAMCDRSYILLSGLAAVCLGVGYGLTETTTNMIAIETKGNAPRTITYQQLSICLGRTIGPWFISFFTSSPQALSKCFLGVGAVMVVPAILIMLSSKKVALQ